MTSTTAGTLLLTGASGLLGRFLLCELALRRIFTDVIAVVRETPDQPGSAIRRLGSLLEKPAQGYGLQISQAGGSLWLGLPGEDALRINILAGDVTWPGLTDSVDNDLLQVTRVCHAAALTSLVDEDQRFQQINVDGTRQVIDFCKQHLPNLRMFVFVGTCYDIYTGIEQPIPASQPIAPQAFVNGYTRSKWQARQMVVDSGLPYCIALPGILTGRAADGYLPDDIPLGVIYGPSQGLALLKSVCQPFFQGDTLNIDFWAPGDAEATLNVLPVDTAAALLARVLAHGDGGSKAVYYLTNPQTVLLEQLLECASQVVGVEGVRFSRDLSGRSAFERLFIRVLSAYQPFMNGRVGLYDTSTLMQVAGDVVIPSPDNELLLRMFRYVQSQRNWGFNEAGAMYKDSNIQMLQGRFKDVIRQLIRENAD